VSKNNNDNNSAWLFFLTNTRVTALTVLAIVVLGLFSVWQMPKESAPEIDVAIAVVTTPLTGSSAADVESLVTNPIEDNIESIRNISELDSTSQTGLSQITVQFEVGVDKNAAITDVRNQVEAAASELPEDAGDPNVQEISLADQPVVTLSVNGPYELQRLGQYAETIADDIRSITNVSSVNVSGKPETEFSVQISDSSLQQYGVSIGQLAQGLQQANSGTPIGSVNTSDGSYTIRYDGRLDDIQDLRSIPVKTDDASVIRVSDIATVERTFSPLSVKNQYTQDQQPPQPSVSIDVFKQSGQGSVIGIVSQVEQVTDSLKSGELPEDVTVAQTRNQADQISNDLNNLLGSGAITMLIIFLVLLLFLGWREAVLASISVPIAFLAGLAILNIIGFTINSLTLFSLILVIGILVDSAIVITEGVSRANKLTENPMKAAQLTIQEFSLPLTAGTLTTVFAFAPMLLAGGIIGEFISTIPVTVSSVLLAALFTALGVIPVLAVLLSSRVDIGDLSVTTYIQDKLSTFYDWYQRLLSTLLEKTQYRTYTFSAITVLFVVAVSFPVLGILQTTLFPPANVDTVSVDLEMPEGTPLADTASATEPVIDTLRSNQYVDSQLITIGSGSNVGGISVGSGGGNLAGIVVGLNEDRQIGSQNVVDRLSDQLPPVTTADVSVSQQSGGPPTGKPVQINLSGGSLESLSQSSGQIVEILEGIPSAINVESSLSVGSSEFSTTLDRAAIQRAGITPQAVATALRARVSGLEATNIKAEDEDIPINITYPDTRNATSFGIASPVAVNELLGTQIVTQNGSVPLETLVDLGVDQSVPSVTHTGGERQVTVSADVGSDTTPPEVVSEAQNRIEQLSIPDDVAVSFGGQQQDVQQSFTDLFLAMIVGIIAIFALLTWQFNSFRQPLYMLATIPLAFIGVSFGLAAVGQPLSFPAFIGIVALAGIVVNNAIILIDRINTNRKDEGTSTDSAILAGARSRVQAIILTTITTAGGVAPLLFADPTWAPLAWAIIFGLSFSTVLTLVIVPLLYQRFYRER
jgi:multidrug efflux pump subunit AcrB